MSTLAKSQNVCTGCRSRKKKCDGERPSCSSCHKRGDLCFYAGAPSQALVDSLPSQWIPVPGLGDHQNVDNWVPSLQEETSALHPQLTGWPSLTLATPVREAGVLTESVDSGQQNTPLPNTSHTSDDGLLTPPRGSTSPSEPTSLPPHDQLQQLMDLYFEKFYKYLPILHKPTIVSKIHSRHYNDSHLLLFSIIAVSASAHPNREIQQSQMDWYNQARSLFSKAIHSQHDPLQTVIAANFIIFQAMVVNEHSAAWVTLGEAWRRAVSAGYNIQDSAVQTVRNALGPTPCINWIEMEECRRAMWMLFICDRGMCFPIGLTHAIDDRQIRINFPIDEGDFQVTMEPSSDNSIQYTPHLDRLITLVQERARKKTATLMQFIVLAYVFLGRVSERIYALDYDYEEQKPHLDALTSNLLRIRLMLPRSATDLSAADYRDFTYVVWLNVIMSVGTILLYHRPLGDGETLDDQTELSTNWPHCVFAARGAVATIRDASRSSTDFVINPHLSAKLFTCGRILVMEYICPSIPQRKTTTGSPSTITRDAALRDDLDILFLTFERLKEALNGVGRKFRNGLVMYIRDDEKHVLESKASGSRGLLRTCERWPQVDDVEYVAFPD
ncbi:fungal-specific transcription factor domain-containing protein [Thelonectria olida]|uniref:Fungal-specific transcription factor domain-containing protein n=1 Tax=Thelonectria olida TaxID=1576542 RepID=A0A9P8W3N0_9HYPO|nr:fungal-specific transcription factor domain-containing protein [Thelonectria olida]